MKQKMVHVFVNEIYNLGNGKGYSVKEVIKTCEKVTGKQASIVYTERRPGDPAQLIATSEKIYKELGWKAQYPLEKIIESAWKWHQQNPQGYKKSISVN